MGLWGLPQLSARHRAGKSDFKRSNLILSVVYMVIHHNFPKTCGRRLARSAADRTMLCTRKNIVNKQKSSPLKLHPNAVKTASHNPLNGKFSASFLSLFLSWCDASSWCVIRCIFRHGRQKSPKKQVLHLTCWVLCVDCTMHRNFSGDIFFLESLVCVFWLDLSPGSSFSAFHFGMVI